MAQPLIGEIRIFAGNFAPAGWSMCDGSLLAISEYDTLFNLLGTTYGGDGQSTFALPNLQSRVPIHQGQGSTSNFILAETGGAETVTLGTNQMPQHNHAFLVSSDTGAQVAPADNVLGTGASVTLFRPLAPNQAMGTTTSPIGGSQPHENMQPYLVLNYIISLFGIYPSQT
ncbi:MAG: phage tail protein [Alphaproteobacteria bacterium]|nr:phage tail protein [Alphaproteobacteria bacterium]